MDLQHSTSLNGDAGAGAYAPLHSQDHTSVLSSAAAALPASSSSSSLASDADADADAEQTSSPLQDKWRTLAVYLVMSSLFVDSLLLTLPISFLPRLLQDYGYTSQQIGILFGSKAIMQVLVNPLCGVLTNRFGPRLPLLIGSFMVAASTFLFAVTPLRYYYLMCVARGLQGVGSSAAFTAGMSLLSLIYPTDETRAEAMGNSMAGIGLAVLLGPPLGGVLAAAGGPSVPFFVVGGITACQFVLLVWAFQQQRRAQQAKHANATFDTTHSSINVRPLLQTNFDPTTCEPTPTSSRSNSVIDRPPPPSSQVDESPTDAEANVAALALPTGLSIFRPLIDPYVLACVFILAIGNGSVAMLEYLLPLYLSNRWTDITTLEMGFVFLPSTLSYLIFTPYLSRHSQSCRCGGRIFFLALGLVWFSATLAVLTHVSYLGIVISLFAGVGGSMAFVESSLPVILAHILDTRFHRDHGYGLVFAAGDMGYSMGYIIGSFAGGAIDHSLDFTWTCYVFAIALVVCVPLAIILRKYSPMPTDSVETDDEQKNMTSAAA